MSEPVQAPRYPEHEKLAKISGKSQAVGEFLEWASSQGLHLCEPIPESLHGYYGPTNRSVLDLLAEFFGIDQDKIEAEKRAMLAYLRGEG